MARVVTHYDRFFIIQKFLRSFTGFFILLLIPATAFTQTTVTFTPAGATGRLGPTQTQINNTYTSGNTLYQKVTINTQGIQEWTVPANGVYTIEVFGAQGGRSYLYGTSNWHNGGKGARMKGDITLSEDDVLQIVVGQKGVENPLNYRGAGGGGGSFVVKKSGTVLLVAAGGGGGAGDYSYTSHGQTGTSGLNGGTSSSDNGGGAGGTNGNGGTQGSSYGAGGAGWISNGGNACCTSYGGYRFSDSSKPAQGGEKSYDGTDGGFGGGGGTYAGGGGAGGYSGGGGGNWSHSGNGGGAGSYMISSAGNINNSAGANEGDGKVIITYCSGFCFESLSVASNNTYADLTLTAGAYNTNGGSGALQANDFTLIFGRNSGVATNTTISSIKKNNNASEGSASALSGGETVIRMFLNVTGVPVGIETIAIKPANGSSIYNSSGTAMSDAAMIITPLADQNGPYITGTSINNTNTQVTVTFDGPAFNTNGGSGNLETTDFSLAISGGSATLNSSTPTSISKNDNSYTLSFSTSGSATGQEVLTVSPVANSIYDATGKVSSTSQNNNTVNLYDTRLQTKTTLEYETSSSQYNQLIQMDHDSYLLHYSGHGTDGYFSTFTINADGSSITEVINSNEWGTKENINYPSLIKISENTYLFAYYGRNTGKKFDGTNVSNTYGQWLSVFQVKNDGTSLVELGQYLHDTYTNNDPYHALIKIDDDTYALAYKGRNDGPVSYNAWGAWVKTFTVNGGNITQVSELRYDNDNATYYHSWVQLDATHFALAREGPGADGYITTFTIPVDGSSITEVNEIEHDMGDGRYNSFVKLDADTYVLAYATSGNDGQISTFTISADGSSITEVATLEHDTNEGIHNSLKKIDSNKFLLAYTGSGTDGYLKTFIIPDDGSSITEASILEHDTNYAIWNSLELVDFDTYALSYQDGSSDGQLRTFEYSQIATSTNPRISTVSIANNNSTIAVTFNEPVYRATGASGALEKEDFALTISGGNATLGSATPTSISISGNVYTLGMNLSGQASGYEKIKVSPVDNSIYDASNNEASISQISNEAYLKPTGNPIILSTSVDAYNTKISVKFLKPLFNTNSGSGLPEVSDFTISLSGGTSTLTSSTPTSISGGSGPLFDFTFATAGVADGNETVTITPVANSLWSYEGTLVATSQSNNSVSLNASFMNPITNFEHNADHATYNSMIHISGNVYAIAYEGANNKGIIQTISISDAGAITNSSYLAVEEHTDNNSEYNQLVHLTGTKYVLFWSGESNDGYAKVFNISNDGQTIGGLSAALEYDTNYSIWISAVKSTDSTLVAAWTGNSTDGYIATFKVAADGSSITRTEIKEHDTSEGNVNSLVRGDSDTYILTYRGHGSDGRIQTFTIPPDGSSITEVANARFADNQASWWHSLVQVDHDTYLKAGNSYDASGTAGNYGVLETFTIPTDGSTITEVKTHKYTGKDQNTQNKLFKLNSNEYLLAYKGQNGDGFIEMYTIASDGNTITKKWQNIVDIDNGEWPDIVRIDKNTIALVYTGKESDGHIQTYDIGTSDNAGPAITNNSLNYSNSELTIWLNEDAYNANNGSGALATSDFALSITGGAATIASATPTSIKDLGNNQYVLGFTLEDTPNGSETLKVLPVSNSIFDINGTASSTTQSNNTVAIFEKVLPTISSTSLASDNSTITATFSEAVFKSRVASGTGYNGSGDLQTTDFVLSIAGGVATLGSTTPTSISKSSNAYTLGINYIGLPNGSEVITVSPAENAIYDTKGNIAATSQSNNTKTFNAEKIRLAKSIEFETGYMQGSALIKRDADTYIAAFMYNNNDRNGDGYLAAFNISADGETLSEININNSSRWGFEWGDYNQGNWVQVDTNTFALAFHDYGNGGYISTFDISADGTTVSERKDRWRFSSSTSTWDGLYNSFVKLSATIYVIAYQDASNRGVITTFTISNDGTTITSKDTEFLEGSGTNSYMTYNSLVKVDDNTLALAYGGASGGAEGWIATFNVDASSGEITGASGSNNKYVNKVKHDNVMGKYNSLVKLGGDKYVLAYTSDGNDGWFSSFTISNDGATITEVESVEHSTFSFYNDLLAIGDESLLLVYGGDDTDGGSSYDGFIKSISINSNGTGISVAATNEFETQEGKFTRIADIDGNTFAVISQGNGTDGFMRTFNVRASDQSAPTITSRSLASDNSTISITFNEDVYAVSNGTGELETSDFALSISGGSATLSSATPTSISKSGNVYTLGIGLASPGSGAETITVSPVANSIFDLAGNITVANQSNNTATLNDKLGPSITGVVIASNNATIDVTLAETAYPGTPNSGALAVEDWVLSIPDTNSTAKLGSATPTSIAKSGNVYTLGLNITGTPDGAEVLHVNPAANSIYDALDNISSTTQSNNTVNLKDKAPAIIKSISVAANNATVDVTMSENVFNASNGQGNLEKTDFAFTLNGGTATLVSPTPTTIGKTGNVYTLGINLSGTPDGAEVLAVTPVANSIYDALGNLSLPEQTGNTDNLNDKASPIISGIDLANNNGKVEVTFSEAIFSKNDGSGALDSLDFVLSLSGTGATLSQASPTTIEIVGNTYTLGVGINGTPTGGETLKIVPAENAIYDAAGNVASTTQSNNTKVLIDKLAPTISTVTPANDNSSINVTFSETVFKTSNGNGNLEVSDFTLTMTGGRATLKSEAPTSISKSGNTYTMGIDINGIGTGEEVITARPKESSIYDNAGNVASSIQSTNTTKLKDLSGPIILSISPSNDNDKLIVTFDEPAFTSSNGTGVLDTSDITLTLTGGSAVLNSSKPDTIFRSGDVYTFGMDLTGKVNGFEVVKIQIEFNTVYDSLGNVASPIQAVDQVNLIDQTAPTFASVVMENDNSTVNIAFSNPVYNTTGGTGALEKNDFSFTLNGGTATLTSAVPTSIVYVDSSKTYKLGLALSGIPDGFEVLTVSPVENSIFDAANNIAKTTQVKRNINLKDKALPIIKSVQIAASNLSVQVQLSEPVYSTAFGLGELTFADFLFSIAGGTASLPLPFPDGIVKDNDSTFTLGIKTDGIQSGRELLTIRPSPGSVYDRAGNEADFFSQINNIAQLTDKQLPVKPTGLVAIPGDRKVTLAWNLSADADIAKYYVYYDTNSDPKTVMDSTDIPTQSNKLITPLTNGTTYYFKVAAVDSSQNISIPTLEASASPIKGSVYTVKTDETGDFSDIQSAIDISKDIDTVLVYPGTYTGGINFSGKKIVVGSLFITTGDTAYIDSTILDGDESSSVATFISGEDSTAVLIGLSLTKGYTTITGGGGIRIENSQPRLRNLKIYNNYANIGGGGISCEACDSRFTDIKIFNNTVSGKGGGIRVFNGANPELLMIDINGNQATENGGGLSIEGLPGNSIKQSIVQVKIANNQSTGGAGGGVYLFASTVNMDRAWIQDNSASLKGGGLSVEWDSELNIQNAFISGNRLTSGDQGTNVYIGKSDQLIGSTEEFNSININMIDTVSTAQPTFSMYTNGLVKPMIINSILIGKIDAAIPTSNYDLYYSYCGDCSNLLTFASNPGNVSGDVGFIDFDKGNFDLRDNSSLLSAANPSYTHEATNRTYTAPTIDINGKIRPNPFGSILDIGAIESEFSGKTLASTGISDGLSLINESDYSNITTTLSARWNPYRDDSTNTYTYEYAIGDTLDNNITDWTNNDSKTQVTVSGLSLENSVTYYTSVRIKNKSGILMGTLKSDGVFIDTQKPVIDAVKDGDNNDVDWFGSKSDGQIVLNITENSGIGTFEYSLGTSSGGRDVMNWKLGQDTIGIFPVEGLLENTEYFANARVTDRVGYVSDIVSSDGFKMDYTIPEAGTAKILNSFQSSTDSITYNWSGFTDVHSGMNSYDVMIGTTLGGNNILSRTPTGSLTTVTVKGLSLLNDSTYYGTIIGIDSVGNEISTLAPGITIDLIPPSDGTVADGDSEDSDWLNDSSSVQANWQGFRDFNGIAKYEVALGTSIGGTEIQDWVDSGEDSSHTFTDLTLNIGVNYYISVRASDQLGNTSEGVSSDGFKIDTDLPILASSSHQESTPLSIFDPISIDFIMTESVQSHAIQVTSAQGNLGSINPIDEKTNNTITVSFTPPFTSMDQISIALSVTDSAGNTNSALQYNYTVSTLSDYNNDAAIDATDLATFTDAWSNTDLNKELGPVTGNAPYFKPTPDNVFDTRDGMAFVRMWQWDKTKASGKLIAKLQSSQGSPLNIDIEADHVMVYPPKGTKAIELILDYPSIDMRVKLPQSEIFSDKGMTLSLADTIEGQLLINTAYFEKSDRPIRIDLQHLQREQNVPVDISYLFLGENHEALGSGNEFLDIKPIPKEFALHNNYPNPFNPVTTINYDLPKEGNVRLIIYDIMGREIAKLNNGFMPAGYHSVKWNARNQFGVEVSAGVYFYQIQAGQFTKTQKMILLK